MDVKLYDYNVVNADNQVIDTISAKNKVLASKKIALKLGSMRHFVKLVKTGKSRTIFTV